MSKSAKLTITEIARMMGVNRDHINGWVDDGLPCADGVHVAARDLDDWLGREAILTLASLLNVQPRKLATAMVSLHWVEPTRREAIDVVVDSQKRNQIPASTRV